MGTSRPNRRPEIRKIADLKPYPQQAEFFDDLSPVDLKALADDIARNGLRLPIMILPDGTILDGHQRVRALKLLGRIVGDADVRYDLEDADPTIIERVFLEANKNRRQLDKLTQARVALRLFVIEKKRPRGELYHHDVAEARDRVGQAIGMSGRNLQRYWRLLKTPVAVQNAVRTGPLGLVMAGNVADLDAKAQAKIAERIQAGEHAGEVIAEYLPERRKGEPTVAEVVNEFARILANGLRKVNDVADEIGPGLAAKHTKTFKAACDVIRKMLDQG